MSEGRVLNETEKTFYQDIGLCITEWARVETQLFRLCAFVLNVSAQHVAIVFHRAPTLTLRMQLTEELVATKLPKRERKDGGHYAPIVVEWKRLSGDFYDLIETRNHLAHWPVVKGTVIKLSINPVTWDGEIASQEQTIEVSQSLTEIHRGNAKKERITPADLPIHLAKVVELEGALNDFYYKLSGELPPGRFALPVRP